MGSTVVWRKRKCATGNGTPHYKTLRPYVSKRALFQNGAPRSETARSKTANRSRTLSVPERPNRSETGPFWNAYGVSELWCCRTPNSFQNARFWNA